MKEYRTIIVVSSRIWDKIELYRKFLEKSEFGTELNQALFVTDDSVEELSSTELNKVQTCLFLYDMLTEKEYADYYGLIEEKRKEYQNTAFYMLFCQDPTLGKPYAESEQNETSVLKTFSIEIIDDKFVDDISLAAELRCIKLLTLALAIAKHNEGGSYLEFNSFYMNAYLTPDYKNIYFSIMHSLSGEADKINAKRRRIKINASVVDFLEKKASVSCEGKFEASDEDFSCELKPFSSYGKMDTLQREMENVYNQACDATEKAVARSIHVARSALAVEEMFPPEFVEVIEDGVVSFEVNENAKRFQNYMTTREVEPEEEAGVARPADLLSRPFADDEFEFVNMRSVFPLAGNFEKSRKEKLSPTILTSIGFAVVFAVFSALIYFARYHTDGRLIGVNKREALIICALPPIALVLAGVVALLVQVFRRHRCKNFFKDIYKRLNGFLNRRVSLIKVIKEYINKYLTVYYNNHIKHSRIASLRNESAVLEHEISEIEKAAVPSNNAAEIVSQLNGARIALPTVQPDRMEGEASLSMKVCLEKAVETKTEITGVDNVYSKMQTPWTGKIAFGQGNLNTGGGI